MIELIRTNDVVLLSFAESLMKEAGIIYFIADRHTSIAEGSLALIQSRFLVKQEQADKARRIFNEAGLSEELYHG